MTQVHTAETPSPGLSELSFIDPHLTGGGGRYATVAATSPRPLRRALGSATGGSGDSLQAEIAGAGSIRDLTSWVTETHTTALLVLDGGLGEQSGRIVHEWYADGVGPETLLLGASMSKSVLAHLVGRAVTAGMLDVQDPVAQHLPELAASGYGRCTVAQLLAMTTGTDWVEDHRDPAGPASRLVGCFHGSPGRSRDLLAAVRAVHPPGSRWTYSTADSQVLDWVRERATAQPYQQALADLWRDLGCVQDAVVALDADGVALAGGGLAACAEDWLRVTAVQLDGTAYGTAIVSPDWVQRSSMPSAAHLEPGRLPSTITTHAGFGWHWWPLDAAGRRVTADGSRGQFGYLDRELGIVVVKTSLWPYADPWVDRQQRDLSYLGLPLVAAAARSLTPRR